MTENVTGTAEPAASARVLLEGLVDYAGLFPPARLDMPAAVREYAAHRESDAAWMLGRFIVPSARLEEMEDAAAALLPRDGGLGPWPISLLGGSDPVDDAERVWAFNERHAHGGRAVIDTMELRASDAAEVEQAVRSVPAGVTPYVEIPVIDNPADLIGVLAGAGARAKVRTGGVTADAFPTPAHVARFIRACGDAGVPFKATAGLHHPIRGEFRFTYDADSATGMMYGFLNVFLTAGFAAQGLALGELEAVLTETDPASLIFDDTGIAWRGRRLDLDDIRHLRARAAVAFGSCSFSEPLADLRALRIL
jgi:hypothetical protein